MIVRAVTDVIKLKKFEKLLKIWRLKAVKSIRRKTKSTNRKKQKTKSTRRKVQEVIDGDTIRVRRSVNGSQFIRIANVNKPDKGQRGYDAAKKKLKKSIEGETVTIRPVGKSYGRTVAEVIHNRKKIGNPENKNKKSKKRRRNTRK